MKHFNSVKLALTLILTLITVNQYLNGQRISKKGFVLKNEDFAKSLWRLNFRISEIACSHWCNLLPTFEPIPI